MIRLTSAPPNQEVSNPDFAGRRGHTAQMAERYFRRFNRAQPENGGCRKDSCGRDRHVLRNEVISCREKWAKLQNEHLELNGHAARVDHRSHRERGLEAAPEHHLGPAKVRQMTDDERKAMRAQREDGSSTD